MVGPSLWPTAFSTWPPSNTHRTGGLRPSHQPGRDTPHPSPADRLSDQPSSPRRPLHSQPHTPTHRHWMGTQGPAPADPGAQVHLPVGRLQTQTRLEPGPVHEQPALASRPASHTSGCTSAPGQPQATACHGLTQSTHLQAGPVHHLSWAGPVHHLQAGTSARIPCTDSLTSAPAAAPGPPQPTQGAPLEHGALLTTVGSVLACTGTSYERPLLQDWENRTNLLDTRNKNSKLGKARQQNMF